MEWADEITFSVFNDAWLTFNNHYNHSNITCEIFRKYVQQGEYIKYNLKDIMTSDIENLNLNRLKATSIKEAYPPSDNPRGVKDIQSVKYHMKNKYTSPCVMIQYLNHYILLDGMHRLVAASLSGKRKIAMLLIIID